MSAESPPLRYAWEGLLPFGSLTVLAAFPKVGKSTFIAPLMLAVAKGKPFLDRPTTHTPVLYLAIEEHPRDVKARLLGWGRAKDDLLWIHEGLLFKSEMKAIEAFVLENKVGLVVLDTLTAWWHVENENDNSEVLRAVEPWLHLARASEASILLVHHTRKAGGEDGRGVRGGSSLVGAVDQIITLERQPKDRRVRRLDVLGRYGPQELLIELRDSHEYRELILPSLRPGMRGLGDKYNGPQSKSSLGGDP